MTFDPKQHLIQLPRRVKDPTTGQWITRLDDYLEVKWRLCWFREKYPHGSILTEAMLLDWDKGIAIYKATVEDGEGGIATGTGTETRQGFEDFVEKSETRSIGRALAALGIGTQFVGDELSEGEHVADAPVPATNGHTPAPTATLESAVGDHPTEAHISALRALALKDCGEPENVLADRIRRAMGLKAGASVTPKLLSRTMRMSTYMELFAYYTHLKAQLAHPTPEVPHGATATPSATPEPTSAAESTPAVPSSASSSASAHGPDATADGRLAATAKLRQEALGWGVKDSEVDHVIAHHPLAAARNLLWKARRQPPSQADALVADSYKRGVEIRCC